MGNLFHQQQDISKQSKQSMSIRKCQFIGKNPQDGLPVPNGIPLKHQEVNLTVNNAVAVIDIVQTFINDQPHPLEVTLKFPSEKDYALGKLTIQIGDSIIEGKILKKIKALERFENAIAGGHTAVKAEEESEDIVKISIGNLLPGQEAIVKFQILTLLKIDRGAYQLKVPLSYFPQTVTDYQYAFSADILADSAITYVSVPDQAEVERPEFGRVVIRKKPHSGLSQIQDLVIFYKTANMDAPVLMAQKSRAHPDEVAVMLSFVPQFQQQVAATQSSDLETAYDERPEPQDLAPEFIEENNFFIFIVDRSGSMSGSYMETTKQALQLFLKSLPSDSQFEIISFGSDFSHLSQKPEGYPYHDDIVEKAINQIKTFQADMGGTEIYQPLKSAVESLATSVNRNGKAVALKKKIFFLTDGEVSSPETVIQFAEKARREHGCQIHTVGIGSGCSVHLVQEAAKAGGGQCTLVPDIQNIRSQVIQALARALEPQFSNCLLTFNKQLSLATNTKNSINIKSPFNIYRHEPFYAFGILPITDLSCLQVSLKSDVNPKNHVQLGGEWGPQDVKWVPSIEGEDDQLYKIVARQWCLQSEETRQQMMGNDWNFQESQVEEQYEPVCLKYQLMSKYTSLIAVNKNDQKPIEEIKEVVITRYVKEEIYEEEERADVDMGGLFGDDYGDEDWGYSGSSPPQMNSVQRNAPQMMYYEAAELDMCISEAMPSPQINCLARASSGSSDHSSGSEDESSKKKAKKQPVKNELKAYIPSMDMMMASEPSSSKMAFASSSVQYAPDIRANLMDELFPMSSALPQMNCAQTISAPQIQPRSFDELLHGQQSTTGSWSNESLILSFFKNHAEVLNNPLRDSTVLPSLVDPTKLNEVWLTLLAIYILTKKFNAKEDEWQLIAGKARAFLKAQGLAKPEALIKQLFSTPQLI
ncbi:hypothetical protein FGO68_gene8442 [Halteria grandinella]|uniref:Uncharacterized protein n=1 Tax=Halteria grandinella TaxID=5974 RepID=A0A8J8P146_HALGN|nr:hypothetical protein FGO68_gene8442 [Halteria grandinella]